MWRHPAEQLSPEATGDYKLLNENMKLFLKMYLKYIIQSTVILQNTYCTKWLSVLYLLNKVM